MCLHHWLAPDNPRILAPFLTRWPFLHSLLLLFLFILSVNWTVRFSFQVTLSVTAMKQSVFILPHLLPAFVWAATCYYPNGNSVTNDQTVPCNNINGAVSMCCVQSDKCLSNGLCKVAATSGVADSKPLYWRDTCSNSDWTNPGCLDICTVCP